MNEIKKLKNVDYFAQKHKEKIISIQINQFLTENSELSKQLRREFQQKTDLINQLGAETTYTKKQIRSMQRVVRHQQTELKIQEDKRQIVFELTTNAILDGLFLTQKLPVQDNEFITSFYDFMQPKYDNDIDWFSLADWEKDFKLFVKKFSTQKVTKLNLQQIQDMISESEKKSQPKFDDNFLTLQQIIEKSFNEHLQKQKQPQTEELKVQSIESEESFRSNTNSQHQKRSTNSFKKAQAKIGDDQNKNQVKFRKEIQQGQNSSNLLKFENNSIYGSNYKTSKPDKLQHRQPIVSIKQKSGTEEHQNDEINSILRLQLKIPQSRPYLQNTRHDVIDKYY